MKRSASEPRTRLHFGDDQPRRNEGVRDVRSEIHLQPVQPENDASDPAEQEMETVDRQATDEDAERDCRGLPACAGALGAQTGKRTPKLNRQAAHVKCCPQARSVSVTLPDATRTPSAVTVPSILYRPPIRPMTRAQASSVTPADAAAGNLKGPMAATRS